MTRGKEANHAFVATDGLETDRHGPTGTGQTGTEAIEVLAAALARSGAQKAAHTARDSARTRTVETARRAAELVDREAAEVVVPAEHIARAAELRQRQDERNRLAGELQRHTQDAADTRRELAGTSRLRPRRRAELVEAIAGHDRAVQTASPRAERLGRDIAVLSRQVAADAEARETEQRARLARPARPSSDEAHLAPARAGRPTMRTAPASSASASQEALDQMRAAELRRRHSYGQGYGRRRDDSPGIGF
ncbi:MAG: hypothetical protein ACT4QF_10290 [Sporichthyaceae bacterium]